jgi:hypothetical protein
MTTTLRVTAPGAATTTMTSKATAPGASGYRAKGRTAVSPAPSRCSITP